MPSIGSAILEIRYKNSGRNHVLDLIKPVYDSHTRSVSPSTHSQHSDRDTLLNFNFEELCLQLKCQLRETGKI